MGSAWICADSILKWSNPNVALNSIEAKHLTECGRVLRTLFSLKTDVHFKTRCKEKAPAAKKAGQWLQ
ncbi:MAG: hypothetical protein DWP98_11820 [Bacteroidetes bacterium]|nr:MAG: hypothetical protein DWP98_11760 [Bacteroidota bacterium]KAA3645193.1 MAG: hypothetical protein DWP98_11820 [Bacteroidota bacterium]MBL1144076.1 hypothetical protein [Bacteroidota bacterium]